MVCNGGCTTNTAKGMKLTDNLSGNTIYLPIADSRSGVNGHVDIFTNFAINFGYYWSSSYNANKASSVRFYYDDSPAFAGLSMIRSSGMSIRCVKE